MPIIWRKWSLDDNVCYGWNGWKLQYQETDWFTKKGFGSLKNKIFNEFS